MFIVKELKTALLFAETIGMTGLDGMGRNLETDYWTNPDGLMHALARQFGELLHKYRYLLSLIMVTSQLPQLDPEK